MNHLLFAPQTAKFAVVQIILSRKLHPQTVVLSLAIASSFSVVPLPVSNQLQPILNRLHEALAESLTRAFRFLVEKL
jgi:hypothetical protein